MVEILTLDISNIKVLIPGCSVIKNKQKSTISAIQLWQLHKWSLLS